MNKRLATLILGLVAASSFGQAIDRTKVPFSGFQALVQNARTRVKEMDIDELKALMRSGEKFFLIDVREGSEWSSLVAFNELVSEWTFVCLNGAGGSVQRDLSTDLGEAI